MLHAFNKIVSHGDSDSVVEGPRPAGDIAEIARQDRPVLEGGTHLKVAVSCDDESDLSGLAMREVGEPVGSVAHCHGEFTDPQAGRIPDLHHIQRPKKDCRPCNEQQHQNRRQGNQQLPLVSF